MKNTVNQYANVNSLTVENIAYVVAYNRKGQEFKLPVANISHTGGLVIPEGTAEDEAKALAETYRRVNEMALSEMLASKTSEVARTSASHNVKTGKTSLTSRVIRDGSAPITQQLALARKRAVGIKKQQDEVRARAEAAAAEAIKKSGQTLATHNAIELGLMAAPVLNVAQAA